MEKKFQIGIVGAGSMGSLFAYYFTRTNIDVVLYDLSHRAMQLQKGLCVKLFDGTCVKVPITASSNPNIFHQSNIIFFFVKSYSTREAALAVSPHISSDAIIVTLQNGIGNKDILENIFPKNPIVYGTTTIGAYISSDGIVCEGGKGGITIGSSHIEALEKVIQLIKISQIHVEQTLEPDVTIWQKAIINAAINPIAALIRIPNGEILQNSHLRKIQQEIIREAVLVAASQGICFNAEELILLTQQVCANTANNRCSMLQDIEAGRKTEINSINGYFVRLARNQNIHVPYNECVYGLISALEDQKKTGVSPGLS